MGFRRKFTRFIILGGDIVTALILFVVFALDWLGYINQIIPFLPTPYPTYIAFGIFVVHHFYQRWHFHAHRPRLEIYDSGWEQYNNNSRLYLTIWNHPYITTSNGDSISTGAEVSIFNQALTKKYFQYEHIRWQGTNPPYQASVQINQPYDNWCVNISAGRRRKLYIFARDKDGHVFAHNDKSYKVGWTAHQLELTEKFYKVRIILWSSDFDHNALWFEFDGENMKEIKTPKKFKEPELCLPEQKDKRKKKIKKKDKKYEST